MKVVDRYIIREFIKAFLFGIIALILVSTVVDIFERVDDIVQHKPPLSVSVTFFLARIPQVLFMIAPISMLLTTLIVMGSFARNSEVIAMLANGISIYRIMVPLLILGFLISVLMLGLNEFIVPTANRVAEECKRIMKGKPDTRKMAKIQIWFRGTRESRIYYINALIPERREIHGLTIFELNEEFMPVKRLDALRAVYHEPAPHQLQGNGIAQGTWTLYQGSERTFYDPKDRTIFSFQERQDYVIPRTFEEFRRETKDPEDMNYRELSIYIDALTASGYDVSKYIVDLRAKFSYPFVSLVMVIIGFPFALKSPRSGAAFGIGISVFIGLTYWVILQLGISLGHAHILPPLLAAWISHVIFACTGFYLILSTRT
ncbi:LPS export ABC transporter permease LptG [candidate division KSB3 bacterium]|uniref:LPS export ABC transporter permease LptG n=1 Tax=candidate division KSB3 bacterium TaxID=2044937 RepID=A0A9D5JXW7_9BACT|nr:LPS export ABC transporter permease LptG [candidate division KSB3 bacterium]MBD3326120.1 LPS export ABC transporter permease LptG [candidate division KSB3 bacterium]